MNTKISGKRDKVQNPQNMDSEISEKRDLDQNPQNIPPQTRNNYIPQQIPNQVHNNLQQYDMPVLMQPGGNVIVANQLLPTIIISSPVKLSLNPVSMTCIFCHLTITTVVEQSFNCGACLLCYITGCCVFFCIQACLNKEIGCCDATHKCPNCGAILGKYTAI